MLNKVFLIGRIGQDPEMRYTPSGVAVTNFSMATNRRWRDKQTGNVQDETTWHDIVCWNKTAEFVGEFGKKGSLVFVEGEIQKRSWEDKNGNKRVSVEVRAQTIQLLTRTASEKGEQPSKSGEGASPIQPPEPEESLGGTEDDVPF